jgi:hypothetical protein
VPHSLVQDRATGVVRGLELREFQRDYRRRRLAAGGRLFPSYADALGRLQAALASTRPTTRSQELMCGALTGTTRRAG